MRAPVALERTHRSLWREKTRTILRNSFVMFKVTLMIRLTFKYRLGSTLIMATESTEFQNTLLRLPLGLGPADRFLAAASQHQ